MKNKLIYLISVLFVAVACFSCSDDDDENPLFGTWISIYTENSTEYKEVITLNSDGTGTSAYYENGQIDKEGVENFKYTYDEKSKILTYIWEDGDVYSVRVTELSSSKLVLVDDVDEEGEGEITTFTKQ